MSEAEELEKLCKPVVDWLKKNHDPHTELHITVDHIAAMYEREEIIREEEEIENAGN